MLNVRVVPDGSFTRYPGSGYRCVSGMSGRLANVGGTAGV